MNELNNTGFYNGFTMVGKGIYKKTKTITDEDCDYIYNFMLNNNNKPLNNKDAVPWDPANGNVLYYVAVKDRRLLDIMNAYKKEMTTTLMQIHNEIIYPHLTTIVLWKPGQKMPRHVDNGFQTDYEDNLRPRKYTSISYINDDFEGGNTYIRSDGLTEPSFRSNPEYSFPNNAFTDYISKPEKGATILFGAGDDNAHGVLELIDGTRVVLSTWFTTDPMFQEPVL